MNTGRGQKQQLGQRSLSPEPLPTLSLSQTGQRGCGCPSHNPVSFEGRKATRSVPNVNGLLLWGVFNLHFGDCLVPVRLSPGTCCLITSWRAIVSPHAAPAQYREGQSPHSPQYREGQSPHSPCTVQGGSVTTQPTVQGGSVTTQPLHSTGRVSRHTASTGRVSHHTAPGQYREGQSPHAALAQFRRRAKVWAK